MDRAHRRPRHRALAVALATLLVPLVVGSTVAAGPKPPKVPPVVVTATVTGASVAVGVSVQHAVKDIGSCLYGVDAAPTIDCTNQVAVSKKSTTYAIALTGQSTGDHTITVTVRHHTKENKGHTGSASFTIAPPRVLATAWTDLNANHVYDPAVDSLIAQIVDTDPNNALSVGDTITTNRFPLDFTGTTFADAMVTSFVVTVVDFAGPTTLRLNAGSNSFIFASGASERYFEELPLQGATNLWDFHNDSCIADFIDVDSGSPSQPTAEASKAFCGLTNNGFIDVIIN